MFKFKMTNNDLCDICGDREALEHVLWQCNRAKIVWGVLRDLLRAISNTPLNVTFEALFIGFNPTAPIVETILARLTQALLCFDRTTYLTTQSVKNIIKSYAFLNSTVKNKDRKQVDAFSWNEVLQWCE